MIRLTVGSAMLIALTALGCASTDRRGGDDDETSSTGDPADSGATTGGNFVPPSEVSLQIRETVARPWGHNNQQWDGTDAVSPENLQKLEEILTSINPYLGATAYIAELANQGWALPDPWGYAELFINGEWSPELRSLGDIETNFEDTCVSSWNVGWEHVPMQETMKMHIALYDEDLQYDDPIGDIELNYLDLIDAVKSNQVFNVQVSDQGQGAILFVSISVTAQ